MALLVRKGWKKKNSIRERERERERERSAVVAREATFILTNC